MTNPPESPSAVAEVSPYLAGEVIGDRYRLEREIGRGGMGVVWIAHSLVLGVDVAVKLIHAETAGPGLATRMAREAHAAARLGHPALVRVFDFGWTNRGDPFLVMEFVQGETLAAKLRREGPIPAIKAVQTLLPVADGLRLAHERSIVHRDIKPDNILLAADALGRIQPKLLDFGIAKIDHAPVNGKLTQRGAVLGSPEYMSPEQAQGLEAVDGRSDVWSLSIALYELITGDVPFIGTNYNALMQAIINDPVTLPPGGDPELCQVIGKGLAKSPEDRWSSMSEFGEALALWLYNHGVKEDLSGNSVRAVWLDGPALEGVVSSRGSELVRRASRANAATVERAAPGLSFFRKNKKLPLILGAGVLAGVVFFALDFWLGADAPGHTRPGATVGPMGENPGVEDPPKDTERGLENGAAIRATALGTVTAQAAASAATPIPRSPQSSEPLPARSVGETPVKRPRSVAKAKKPTHDFGF